MIPGRGGDIDHLAAQALNQRAIFAFGIYDDDVVLCREGHPGDLLLGGEGFAGAGDAQDKAVSVQQLLPVCHNQVFADDVLPVVDAALVPDLLGLEGHEDGQGLGGQGPQSVDPPKAQRQGRHQPVGLLPMQRGQLAQVLPGGGL